MGRLTHLHLRHPVNDLAWIEIAKNPAFKLQQQRRMNGVTKIEQRVWPGQSIEQFVFRNSDALQRIEMVRAFRFLVIEQAIASGQPMSAQLPPEVVNLALILAKIPFARHVLEPDRVEFQAAQSEHPLQRHRKVATTLEIFRRKPAAEKNSHASRVFNLLACSSQIMSILEDAAVRQVCLALRLMRLVAQSGVRNWRNRAKELRLLPSHQRLLEIVGKCDKLRFMQECAVHQHPCRST